LGIQRAQDGPRARRIFRQRSVREEAAVDLIFWLLAGLIVYFLVIRGPG
jgi:hypothetical protein